jgi:hypothetical protein
MMRVAPDNPKKLLGFKKSRFETQVVCQAGVPFTSSKFQQSQNQVGQ